MNRSTSVRLNLAMTCVWLLGALAGITIGTPRPLVAVVAGTVVGLVVGLLQRTAMRRCARRLRRMPKARDVHEVFRSAKSGQEYLFGLRAGMVVLLLVSLLNDRNNVIPAGVTGISMMLLVRDLVTWPELLRIHTSSIREERSQSAEK